MPEKSQSVSEAMALLNPRVTPTARFESGEAMGLVLLDPTCMQTVTP